ncbi:MAG: efflux RND transporter periplasmic adaptor subunit [Deltaproteobacteria bacterium]|nr:efflux RND transporter periplasmic adaptor subunit [Deltaproteobacteria bacterium]
MIEYISRLIVPAFLSLAITGCSSDRSGGGTGNKPLVPVVVAEVGRKDMPEFVHAIGRVTSPRTVTVKPQVTGTILEVSFTDGQAVMKGDPLFIIDKRPFEVALEQARATYNDSKTKADYAREQATRYAALGKTGAVSKTEASDFDIAAKAAASAVEVAAADVKSAELKLEYCLIRAPIGGRVGKALITEGNVVTSDTSELVVLNQLAPVEVTFAIAEQKLDAVQRAMADGKPIVTARVPGNADQTATGELVFVDNAVKPATGTIELKAAFQNEPQLLWPGQFVRILLEVGIDRGAVVVPAAAVQDGQDSKFVFVIKPDNTAELRKVNVARTQNDEAIVIDGLAGGENVVIDGQSRLTIGSTVDIVPHASAPLPPTPVSSTPAPTGQP